MEEFLSAPPVSARLGTPLQIHARRRSYDCESLALTVELQALTFQRYELGLVLRLDYQLRS